MARQDDSPKPGKGKPEDVATLRQTLAKLKRKLDDQNERIEALARGREQGMMTVSQLRQELALVAADRDQLRRQLTQLEIMQRVRKEILARQPPELRITAGEVQAVSSGGQSSARTQIALQGPDLDKLGEYATRITEVKCMVAEASAAQLVSGDAHTDGLNYTEYTIKSVKNDVFKVQRGVGGTDLWEVYISKLL